MARFEITSGQSRAARSLLGWSQTRLAREAKVGRQTIARFELGEQTPLVTTLTDIIQAFERFGIEFLTEGDDTPGVLLRRTPPSIGRDGFRPSGAPIIPREAGLARLERAFNRISADLRDVKGAAIHGDDYVPGDLEHLRMHMAAISDEREAVRMLQNAAYAIETAFDLGRIAGEDRALKDREGR